MLDTTCHPSFAQAFSLSSTLSSWDRCAAQVTEIETADLQTGNTEAERASSNGRKDNLWKERPFPAKTSAPTPILKGDSKGDKERHSHHWLGYPLKDMNPCEDWGFIF